MFLVAVRRARSCTRGGAYGTSQWSGLVGSGRGKDDVESMDGDSAVPVSKIRHIQDCVVGRECKTTWS